MYRLFMVKPTVILLLKSVIACWYFRCIKMALVHDLAECIVGDIAPSDGVSKEDKHRRETVRVFLTDFNK